MNKQKVRSRILDCLFMHGWQANKKRTCAQPVKFKVIPENEIPRVSTRGYLFAVPHSSP